MEKAVDEDGGFPVQLEPDEVKAIRKHLQLKQHELADRIGVSCHTVEAWEQGRRRCRGPAATLLRALWVTG